MALSLNLELQGDQSAEARRLGRGLVGLSPAPVTLPAHLEAMCVLPLLL